jgi:hypothetical protein
VLVGKTFNKGEKMLAAIGGILVTVIAGVVLVGGLALAFIGSLVIQVVNLFCQAIPYMVAGFNWVTNLIA